jgi:hypothetical protein
MQELKFTLVKVILMLYLSPLPCAPSTSNGFTGLRSNLGKFFRPQYRYSEVESDEDILLSQDNFEIESSLPKVVKPFSNLENSQTSSIIEKPSTKIACPFSPLHLFKDEKRLRTHVGKYHCDKQVDISNTNVPRRSIQEKLINLHSKIHTLRRIPKGARNQSADKLSSVIHECINSNSILAWENLFVFAYISFNLNGSKIKNLTSKIKDNIAKFNYRHRFQR